MCAVLHSQITGSDGSGVVVAAPPKSKVV